MGISQGQAHGDFRKRGRQALFHLLAEQDEAGTRAVKEAAEFIAPQAGQDFALL